MQLPQGAIFNSQKKDSYLSLFKFTLPAFNGQEGDTWDFSFSGAAITSLAKGTLILRAEGILCCSFLATNIWWPSLVIGLERSRSKWRIIRMLIASPRHWAESMMAGPPFNVQKPIEWAASTYFDSVNRIASSTTLKGTRLVLGFRGVSVPIHTSSLLLLKSGSIAHWFGLV